MPSLFPTILGFFIQAGFALLTCGLVRKKNAAHLVMLTFSAYVFAFLGYYGVGYAIQSGFHGFFLRGIQGNGRLVLDAAFMLVAGYVLVGAVCERISFRGFIVCELFLGAVLYPIFANAAWHGGWLARRGFIDFAGSTVVHSLGGFCAMAIAMVLGSRLGKYGRDGQPQPFIAHNIVFVAVGSFIVLCGWMGLVVAALPDGSISGELLAMNVSLAAVGGAASAMAFWTFWYGKPDISMACNGLLAGAVAISASGPLVGPTAALVIGAAAGLIACGGVLFHERTLKIDDPCGSIAVHGYAGWWGAVAVGVFASSQGASLLMQFAGATLSAVYAFGLTYGVFAVINASWRLRVDAEVEAEGLDLTQFGMLAYPDDEGLP
jgi:ammonium transporter, Amt family